ncbi:glycosyltransferase family 2 protein [Arhodomonas sp. SL1]|uniref:glycosyltransferase family 2 protein n=1 Tax=Arhodomonas sp. SL1 TaxID=3425691 RepID=UPI003F883B37
MTSTETPKVEWQPGRAPIAVLMISLNEAHNMRGVLDNLVGWAQEVFLVDSFSSDETVDIAHEYGVRVVQREFQGFGDQWNFAVAELPISAPWSMKLDPDERLSEELKKSIGTFTIQGVSNGFSFERRLWFMGRPLPIKQEVVRGWRTGSCTFTNVSVNEHPIIDGGVEKLKGVADHYDSPNLHHWVEKQNRYTSAEAEARYYKESFAGKPTLFGSRFERRMWFKKNYKNIPMRHQLQFILNCVRAQVWHSGKAGIGWARHRVWVQRLIEDKLFELNNNH